MHEAQAYMAVYGLRLRLTQLCTVLLSSWVSTSLRLTNEELLVGIEGFGIRLGLLLEDRNKQ